MTIAIATKRTGIARLSAAPELKVVPREPEVTTYTLSVRGKVIDEIKFSQRSLWCERLDGLDELEILPIKKTGEKDYILYGRTSPQ